MRAFRGLVVVGVLAALVHAAPVSAGTPTVKQKGTVIDTVEILATGIDLLTTSPTLFTVPEGQVLVVTDIVITSSSGVANSSQRIFRNLVDDILPFVSVPENGVASLSFATGITFEPGDTLSVRNGASSAQTSFFIGGYLTKAPKN